MRRTEPVDLATLSRQLAQGQSLAGQVCPFCEGGRSNERSFSVFRDSLGLRYRCHRASCSKSGYYLDSSGKMVQSPNKLPFSDERRPFNRPSWSPSEEMYATLYKKYKLDRRAVQAAGIRETFDDDNNRRYLFQVDNRYRQCIGHVSKSMSRSSGPRVLTYKMDLSYPWQAWYFNPFSKDVVIVEDNLSAIVLSSRVNAVALLGTHLSLDKVLDIREVAKANKRGIVSLALDADAFEKTVKFCSEFSGILSMRPLFIPKDFKDMDNEMFNVKLAEATTP